MIFDVFYLFLDDALFASISKTKTEPKGEKKTEKPAESKKSVSFDEFGFHPPKKAEIKSGILKPAAGPPKLSPKQSLDELLNEFDDDPLDGLLSDDSEIEKPTKKNSNTSTIPSNP